MKYPRHESCVARLARIEGQVRGIARMIENERYCIDVLTQLRSVKGALRKVEDEILADHVEHCVDAAITSGDGNEQRRKVTELIDVLGKFPR